MPRGTVEDMTLNPPKGNPPKAEGAGHFSVRLLRFPKYLEKSAYNDHSTPDLVSFTLNPSAARRSRIRSDVAQSLFDFA